MSLDQEVKELFRQGDEAVANLHVQIEELFKEKAIGLAADKSILLNCVNSIQSKLLQPGNCQKQELMDIIKDTLDKLK